MSKLNLAWEFVAPFWDWLEEPVLRDDMTDEEEEAEIERVKYQLKPKAPPEAIERFNEYLQVIRQAEIDEVKI